MPQSKETYQLSKIKQLVDLNGDLTNFNLTFKATAKGGEMFEALVVDQTTLDSQPSLDYKQAPGFLSGNIIADKGVYQNYFLIMRSLTPCEVEVELDIKEIPPNLTPSPSLDNTPMNPRMFPPQQTCEWTKYIWIPVVIGVGIVVYYFMSKTKNNDNDDDLEHLSSNLAFNPNPTKSSYLYTEPSLPVPTPTLPEPSLSVPTPTLPEPSLPVPTPTLPEPLPNPSSRRINDDLLARLKNLPIHN